MQVNTPHNINFQSKNKTIRFADDIARHVNKCYPRISTSLIDDFVSRDVEVWAHRILTMQKIL